jgi:hypothetical protein
MAKRNPRAGSSFDDFLKEDGIYEDAQNGAIKKVLASLSLYRDEDENEMR